MSINEAVSPGKPASTVHGLLLVAALWLGGCTGVPENVEPVQGFELDRYLGTWYEIARLDHPFERGLENVTAHYSLRPDGGVAVLNRGYRPASGEWEEADGKAYFVDEPTVGRLKVSFFGPFYGGYNIARLDQDGYQWSLVVGPNTDYLWILAREPQLDPQVYQALLDHARERGFAVDEVIRVRHDPR